MFAFRLTWRYTIRLIFWGRVPPRYQDMVRTALTIFIACGLPLAAITIFFVATQVDIRSSDAKGDTLLILWSTVIGVLCQISTIIWLLRYRKE